MNTNKTSINPSDLDALIGQHFSSTSVTHLEEGKTIAARYKGRLLNKDTEKGFEKLMSDLTPFNLIAILREDEGNQFLTIQKNRMALKEKKPRFNLVMFLLTLLSVLFTGGLYGFQGELPENTLQMVWTLIKSGWPFALSMLGILGAHEFGHYFAGKKNGVDVTLPFFIPFPFSSFGTMGAFINMRSLPITKRELFDIAIAGPLSGLVVSIIVLTIGLNLSELNTLPLAAEAGAAMQMEGNSILYLLMKYLTFKKILPMPENLQGIGLLIHWSRYFFTGLPFPWGAEDVMLHPVAWAGWAGLFVTSINLLPVGQLDGGHISQTVFGEKFTKLIFPFIICGLIIMGFFWNGWWMWAGLLFITGRRYAQPLNQVTQLDIKRKILGYIAVLIFVITFTPVPISIVGY